jgi:hypothetical protein
MGKGVCTDSADLEGVYKSKVTTRRLQGLSPNVGFSCLRVLWKSFLVLCTPPGATFSFSSHLYK